MKKTYNILLIAIVLLTGITMSCKPDQNEWSVDSSMKRQYAPSSLEAEIDSFSLDMTIKIGTLASAKSYEVQFSTNPLLSGQDETTGIPTIETTEGEVTIARNDSRLGDTGIEEGAIYYVRVRAIGTDGTKSKWYSNGMVYNDGYITDAKLIETMKKNAAYKVSAPKGMWVTGIEETSMKLNWYMLPAKSSDAKKAYCKAPSYIINETLKEAGAAESDYKHDITASELEKYQYEWTNLEVGKKYQFTLYDEEGMKIGTTTESTEYAPNMSLAMSLTVNDFDKTAFTTKGEPYTLTSAEVEGRSFTVTFNNETGGGWTANRNDWVSNPENKALNFNIRAQLKKNTTTELKFPCAGRLYIYAYNSSVNTVTLTQTGQETQKFSVVSTKQKIPTVADETTTQNSYLSYKVRVVEGDATLMVEENSIYFFGFCFVPDDPNAGNE